MATPWLAAGLAVPALFLLGGGKDKGSSKKKLSSSRGGEGLVDLDEFDRYESRKDRGGDFSMASSKRRRRRRKLNLLRTPSNRNDSPVDDSGDPTFVCERVCASPRLLRRMGGLSRDATPRSCVTVCGSGQEEACAEACQRAVCSSLHQVPAWNDACLKRCTNECARGRAG